MSRLDTISADALCSVVRLQARKHCEELCLALGTTAATLPLKTPIEEQVEALVAYAKTGAWTRPDDAQAVLREVHRTLYASAAEFAVVMSRAWLAHPEDTIALLARVCLARATIAAGENVPRPWLASLADRDEKSLREAVKAGELVCVEGARPVTGGKEERPVTAASAKAWLARRGVAGYASADPAQ